MHLTKDDFNNWWNSPVAEEFKAMLREDSIKLSRGNMTTAYARDHIGNAIEVGRFQRNEELLRLTYEQLGI